MYFNLQNSKFVTFIKLSFHLVAFTANTFNTKLEDKGFNSEQCTYLEHVTLRHESIHHQSDYSHASFINIQTGNWKLSDE
jgi:hypothetical protein